MRIEQVCQFAGIGEAYAHRGARQSRKEPAAKQPLQINHQIKLAPRNTAEPLRQSSFATHNINLTQSIQICR